VKKWKKAELRENNGYLSASVKEAGRNKLQTHDFVMLTDQEDFVVENTDFIEGFHHLNESHGVYNLNKHHLSQTSDDKDIAEVDFK